MISVSLACGVKPRSGRIVGGEETEPHEFPWQVFLSLTVRKGRKRSQGLQCAG